MGQHTKLEKALDFVGRDAQYQVLDALTVVFHNTWADISGNTEGSDQEWFARVLWQNDIEQHHSHGNWDNEPDEVKEHYRHMAGLCIECLPRLTDRIAHRYEQISEAIKVMWKVEYEKRKKGW